MRIVKVSLKNLNEAVKIIKEGGVVVCPTDTVYGLIVDAKNKTAVKKIFEIKKRSFKKPRRDLLKNLFPFL
jgi:L-threonylcarbamoyladenylate synthase